MADDSVRVVRQIVSLPDVRKAVETTSLALADSLAEYAQIAQAGKAAAGKSVKDAVWGMIQLDHAEMAVVDSPVFQRLRRIHQLGVTYLTFPTASYSRFEHSIGVLHQATRMIDAITLHSSEKARLQEAKSAVRLASLVHDIGHLPFSHVSERHFQENPDGVYSPALQAANEKYGGRASFSEFLSFCVVQSCDFRRLLLEADYGEDEIASASLAVIGHAPRGQEFLKQIISNIVDADKLDYMFRDSMFTSVPLPVDLDRLLYKLRCVQQKQPGKNGMFTLAVDLSGAHLVDDLVVARRILTRQVYHHHKTLAAEQLVLHVLRELNVGVQDLLVADDSFFSEALHQSAGGNVRPLLRALAARQLPRRALGLAERLIRAAQPGADDIAAAWGQLRNRLLGAAFRGQLSTLITARAREIAAALNFALSVRFSIYVDRILAAHAPDAELCIEFPDGRQENYSTLASPLLLNGGEDVSFVYCTGGARDAEIAHLAAEEIFCDAHGVLFDRGAADHAKISYSQLSRMKRDLELGNPDYYRRRRALRSAYIDDSDRTREAIDAVRGRIGEFYTRPDNERVERFVSQFPAHLHEAVLGVLAEIQFFAPRQIAEGINEKLRQNGLAGQDVALISLSGIGESGGLASYYLRQLDLRTISLDDARAEQFRQLVFYEDSLLTGVQASSIVNSWFGLEARSQSDRNKSLSQGIRKWLKKCNVHFVFFVGEALGRDALAKCVRQTQGFLGGTDAAIHWTQGARRLRDLPWRTEMDELRSFLQQVGTQLLLSTRHIAAPTNWPPDRCEQSALGYAGMEALVTFATNCPTASLTALWLEGGLYDGQPWLPLLPRVAGPNESVARKPRPVNRRRGA